MANSMYRKTQVDFVFLPFVIVANLIYSYLDPRLDRGEHTAVTVAVSKKNTNLYTVYIQGCRRHKCERTAQAPGGGAIHGTNVENPPVGFYFTPSIFYLRCFKAKK